MFNSNPFDPNPAISNIMRNMPGHCLTPTDTLKMNLMDQSPTFSTLNYEQKYNICKGYPSGASGMPKSESILNYLNSDGSINWQKIHAHEANREMWERIYGK